MLDGKIPHRPIERKCDRCHSDIRLVNATDRRRHTVLVVVSGLDRALLGSDVDDAGLSGGQTKSSNSTESDD